jgi:hypothetical protein
MNPIIISPQQDGLYLVPIESDGQLSMVIPVVDPKSSLQAEADEETGQFIFRDVEPGIYALVAITNNEQQFSIRRLDTGEIVTVIIEKGDLGQVIDLGQLRLP